MATFTTRFLGCKVSYADAQAIRERLRADGHREVGRGGQVAVVNGCCVTHEAVSKTRQAAARAARTADTVYVTGCASTLDGALDGLPPNVVVTRHVGDEAAEIVAGDVGAIGCVQADHRLDRVRAFVKIQDGCSFACTFCVIPIVRGATRSRRPEAVLDEIRRRVRQGHREVVLTGVNLGLFRAAGYTLPRLVREAGGVHGLERLRLSSIEINHVDRALADALRETPVVSRHLHVPLQAGDDRVLTAMGRRYTVDDFLRRLEPFTEFNLTTDVIVGFPAEDDAAFERTLDTVRRAGVTKVHVFPYSPRPGTATAAQDTVPRHVKRARSERLRSLSHDRCLERWRSKVTSGVVDRVLVDRPGRGYADDYSPWLVDAPVGAFVAARAVAVRDQGIVGVPI